MASAPQCRRDALIEHPANRQLNDALVEAPASKLVEPLYRGKIVGESRLVKLRVAAAQIVALECGIRSHPSRQQATAQCSIAECRDLVVAAIAQEIRLDAAFEQVVGRLQHVQRRDAAELV